MKSTENPQLPGLLERRVHFTPKSQLTTRLKVFLVMLLKRGGAPHADAPENLETAEAIMLDPALAPSFKDISVGVVREPGLYPAHPKFKRFLEKNNIRFGLIDIHTSSWLEAAAGFDVIVWTPKSSPWRLDEAREKILMMETFLGKVVFPSYREIMLYENKLLQYDALKALGLPIVEAFISHDYEETLQWIGRAEYPFVSKVRASAGGSDIKLIRSERQARLLVERIFRIGRPTTSGVVRQKDYVYFQRFVPNHGYDLRIIVVDSEYIFGYYRLVPGDDFRASGFGDIIKSELPEEAMRIALEVTKRLDLGYVSVDFVRSRSDDRFYIIESSIFSQIDNDMQTIINGVSGRYRYRTEDDRFEFVEGRYWTQELVLRRFLQRSVPRILARRQRSQGAEGSQ